MGTKPVLYMPRYYCTIMERHLNGKDTIYKENALVQYDDENNEYFYPGDKDNGYENMRNYVMWFYNLLDGIEDEELDRKVKKYFLKGKDSRITLGSQFFKGIMGNFINHIGTTSFNGIFNQHILDLAGIDKKVGDKLTGQELDKIYTKTYEKYSNIINKAFKKNPEEIWGYLA